jgi:putative hydrolase of the HAD superfamily
MKSGSPRRRFLLCDLDNTLYPPDSGLMAAVAKRMLRYIVERVGIPADEAEQLKVDYYHRYGTTMRGLILHHGADPEDYLIFVHDVPLERFLQPDPNLDAMLEGIPLRKSVFTNAYREHARRVLAILGVDHHFERIIDVRDMGFDSKPHPNAYQRALDILGVRPDECIMADDSADNLVPARALGMLTVLVGNQSSLESASRNGADMNISDILDLARAIRPWIED